MRISDWSSDVCSSDLLDRGGADRARHPAGNPAPRSLRAPLATDRCDLADRGACVMAVDSFLSARNPEMSLCQKIWQLNWGMMLLLSPVAGVGFDMLSWAGTGSFELCASAQVMCLGPGLGRLIGGWQYDIRGAAERRGR